MGLPCRHGVLAWCNPQDSAVFLKSQLQDKLLHLAGSAENSSDVSALGTEYQKLHTLLRAVCLLQPAFSNNKNLSFASTTASELPPLSGSRATWRSISCQCRAGSLVPARALAASAHSVAVRNIQVLSCGSGWRDGSGSRAMQSRLDIRLRTLCVRTLAARPALLQHTERRALTRQGLRRRHCRCRSMQSLPWSRLGVRWAKMPCRRYCSPSVMRRRLSNLREQPAAPAAAGGPSTGRHACALSPSQAQFWMPCCRVLFRQPLLHTCKHQCSGPATWLRKLASTQYGSCGVLPASPLLLSQVRSSQAALFCR